MLLAGESKLAKMARPCSTLGEEREEWRELRGHAEHCACAARGPRLVGLLRAGETAAPALCHGRAPASGARGENCAQLPVSQERMLLWLPCRTEGEKHVCSSLALGVFFQRLSSRHADPGFSADSVNSDIMVVVRRIKRSTVIYLKLT